MLAQVSEPFWTGVRLERAWGSRESQVSIHGSPPVLRLLSPPRRAGHAPCRERPALQHPLRGAARPSVRAAGHTDGPGRAAPRLLGVPQLRSEPACRAGGGRLPFGRQTAAEGSWVGRCLQTQPQPPPAQSCSRGVSAIWEIITMAPRSAKEHLAAEEVSYECSHNRCCKKWHSSHGKPLKILHGPRARASPTPLWCSHPYRRVCSRGCATLALQWCDRHGKDEIKGYISRQES